jgi:hypothetical protein
MGSQKSTDQFWLDEAGNKIPYNRTTTVERLMERQSAKLLKDAKDINKTLSKFKELIGQICDDVFQQFLKEKAVELKERKGNFTWYNFNRSIKIEVAINERITFDELTITAAREKLNTFLDANVDGKIEFVKDLVNEAFLTSKGQLDAKKVMGLLKYKSKIKHADYQDAMSLIEQSIRRPSSKTYFRIWEMDEKGQYQAIDLNFSSIQQ